MKTPPNLSASEPWRLTTCTYSIKNLIHCKNWAKMYFTFEVKEEAVSTYTDNLETDTQTIIAFFHQSSSQDKIQQ